jgi:hypothetical protein
MIMSDAASTPAAPAVPPPEPVDHEARGLGRLLTIAWMAVVFGLLIQLLVLLAKMAAGAPFPGMRWLPDVMGGVTWSLIVCAGVGLGIAASEARKAVMGVLGLVSAPVAFVSAKGVQRAVQSFMEAPVDKLTPLFYATAGVRAVEYACLGAALGWLMQRPGARTPSFAAAGAVAGLVFGGITIGLNMTMGSPKPPQLASLAVNELLFPIGCAVIIYLASRAGRLVATLQDRGAV